MRFKDEKNREQIEDILKFVSLDETWQQAGDRLAGQTFVITGKLEGYSNRGQLKEKIEEAGGKVSGSVSSKTSYLINNDIESTSGKNKKARELGVPIIDEATITGWLVD